MVERQQKKARTKEKDPEEEYEQKLVEEFPWLEEFMWKGAHEKHGQAISKAN